MGKNMYCSGRYIAVWRNILVGRNTIMEIYYNRERYTNTVGRDIIMRRNIITGRK
jgi:hypothetical protein